LRVWGLGSGFTTSHTATTWSFPDDSRYLPLGDHATSTTLSEWPSFADTLAVAASASTFEGLGFRVSGSEVEGEGLLSRV
jgi:hypothetical protein